MRSTYFENLPKPNNMLVRRFEIASGRPPIANLTIDEHERIYKIVVGAKDFDSLPAEIREMVEAAEAN